jgi:hypothetical protein
MMCTEFGLSDYMAKKWLEQFVSEGRLVKCGSRQQALYFLAASD